MIFLIYTEQKAKQQHAGKVFQANSNIAHSIGNLLKSIILY